MFALQLRDGSIALPAGRALTTRPQANSAARHWAKRTGQSLVVVTHPGVLTKAQALGFCRECNNVCDYSGGCACI